jgi:hypothetical protein
MTYDEFLEVIDAVNKRLKPDNYQDTGVYTSKLISTGLALNNLDGKNAVIVLLGGLALKGIMSWNDSKDTLAVALSEAQARECYDPDYSTMVKFIEMLILREKLMSETKTEGTALMTKGLIRARYPEKEPDGATTPPAGTPEF